MLTARVLLVIAGLGALEGCGSSSGSGGPLSGMWNVKSSAVTFVGIAPDPSCPNSTVSESAVMASGDYTFRGDGTFTATRGTSGTTTFIRSSQCFFGAQSCDGVGAALTNEAMSTTCTPPAATDACTCVSTLTVPSFSVTGTYSAAAGLLEVTSNGDTQQVQYSVTGSTLTLTAQSNGPLMPEGTITLAKS